MTADKTPTTHAATRRPYGLLRMFVLAGVVSFSGMPCSAVDLETQGAIERGHVLLEEKCSPCHVVNATGESPLQSAPPFRSLHEKYAVSDLEEALAEGIVSGHPAMPEFTFEPTEIADIVAFLQTLQ